MDTRSKKKKLLYFKVPFIHPIIEHINIPSLIHNKKSKLLLPMTSLSWEPTVCYSYSNTIGQSLFNYNKILKNMDANDVIHTQKCDCDSNIGLKPFIFTPHGHVYTGDMDIFDNIALRELMKKGSKFREIPNLNIHSVKYHHLTVALNNFVSKWANTSGTQCDDFNMCKQNIHNTILARLYTYIDKNKYNRNRPILNQTNVINCINDTLLSLWIKQVIILLLSVNIVT